MNVNQTRCDDVIFDIDDLRAVACEIRSDIFDVPVAHANVENSVFPDGGINQTAASQYKVSQCFALLYRAYQLT